MSGLTKTFHDNQRPFIKREQAGAHAEQGRVAFCLPHPCHFSEEVGVSRGYR
jgi:hypothetical protein